MLVVVAPLSLCPMQRNRRLYNRTAATRILHPQSRVVDQMQRQMRHNIRRDVVHGKHQKSVAAHASKLLWFRDQLEDLLGTTDSLTTPDGLSFMFPKGLVAQATGSGHTAVDATFVAVFLNDLAWGFVSRHASELAELKSRRNPPKGQIKGFESTFELEKRELLSSKGFLVPDIRTPEGYAALMTWDVTVDGSRKVPCFRFTSPSERRIGARGDVFTPVDLSYSDADEDAVDDNGGEDEAVEDDVPSDDASGDGDDDDTLPVASAAAKQGGSASRPQPRKAKRLFAVGRKKKRKQRKESMQDKAKARRRGAKRGSVDGLSPGLGLEKRRVRQAQHRKARRHAQLALSRGLI